MSGIHGLKFFLFKSSLSKNITMRWLLLRMLTTKKIHLQQKRSLALSYNIVNEGESTQTPLLMIHGLLGNKKNFTFVGRLLQAKLPEATIITCDVRNHGESPHSDIMDYHSMSGDIVDLMETLKLPRCNILGHSLGGRIAMHMALTHADKVQSLIAVDIAPRSKGESHAQIVKFVEAMKLVHFEEGMKRSQARISANEQLTNAIPEKAIRDYVLTNLVQQTNGVFCWRVNVEYILQNMKHLSSLSDEEKFTKYEGKTMFLGGELSDYITPDVFPDIKRLFPNAAIHHIPDCGHWVHDDNPHEFANVVANFLVDD